MVSLVDVRKPGRRRLSALVGLLLLAALGCQLEYAAGDPPRPENVGSDAAWIGGPDGGVWVTLRPDAASGQGIYHAKIQHETGSSEYEGPLRLERANGGSEASIDVSLIEGWDGDELLLSDGRSLRVPN